MNFIKLRQWRDYDIETANIIRVKPYSISHMTVRGVAEGVEPITAVFMANGSTLEVLETPEQIIALCKQCDD